MRIQVTIVLDSSRLILALLHLTKWMPPPTVALDVTSPWTHQLCSLILRPLSLVTPPQSSSNPSVQKLPRLSKEPDLLLRYLRRTDECDTLFTVLMLTIPPSFLADLLQGQ